MTKLYRSRTDSKLFGLCGGLAQMLNVDSTLLRVIVLITAFFSGGTVIPLYFIACLVIPKEPVFDFQPMHPYANDPYAPPYGSRPPGGAFGQSGVRPYDASGPTGRPYEQPGQPYSGQPGERAASRDSRLDEMMREVERKALQKEIEELRAKLAKYEKAGSSDSGDGRSGL